MTTNEWTVYDYREYARKEAGAYPGQYDLIAIARKLRDKCGGAKPSEEMIEADELTALYKKHNTRNVEVYEDSLGRLSTYVCVNSRIEYALFYGTGTRELDRAAEDYVRLCLGKDPWYSGWDSSSYLMDERNEAMYKQESDRSKRVAYLAMYHLGYRYGVDSDSHKDIVRKFAEAVEYFADLEYL